MFESLKKSWRIFKESWGFLRKNSDLWWIAWWAFPLFTLCCAIAVGLPALIGFFALSFQGEPFIWHNFSAYLTLHYHFYMFECFLGFITLLIAGCTAAVFCNSVAFICIYNRMRNKPTSLFQGLRQTGPYLSKILFWGLICGVAKLFLNNRQNRIADVVEQAAWDAVSYFIIPIMIDKNVGPVKAVALSKQSLAREWKSILGFGGIYYLFYLALGVLIVSIIKVASAHHNSVLVLLMIMIVFPLTLFLIIVSQPFISILGMVLKTALYIDSLSGDDVVLHFDKDLLSEAIIMKKQ